jgi:putative endonuclease
MRERTYFVYILASSRHGTLYIGITNDLDRRLIEHRTGVNSGFASRYGVNRLVHVETFSDVRLAIQHEKTLKKWPRQWKINLIERANPDWSDLAPTP